MDVIQSNRNLTRQLVYDLGSAIVKGRPKLARTTSRNIQSEALALIRQQLANKFQFEEGDVA